MPTEPRGDAADIKLITFDLDDTLWAMRPVMVEADRRAREWLADNAPRMTERYDSGRLTALRKKLVNRDPSLTANLTKLRTTITFEACRRAGYSDADARRLADEAFEVFIAARHEVILFDGVAEMLQSLRERYLLAALTNGNADIKRLGLTRYFHFGYSSESVGKAKPDPAMFEAALAHAGVTVDQTIHVGDSAPHDIRGAQRLGIRTVWINPDGAPYPMSNPPDAELRHVTELDQWLHGQPAD